MDLGKYSAEFKPGDIHQFCQPFCFELAGEKFVIAMDNGYDYMLTVKDKDTVSWSVSGERPQTAKYQCLKGDDTTYLIHYDLKGVEPRVNHTFDIDRENYLVTQIVSSMGWNPKYPYLIRTDFDFGVIRLPGQKDKDLTLKRHGFTGELLGNAVCWTYGNHQVVAHLYTKAGYYRTARPEENIPKRIKDVMTKFPEDISVDKLPSADEPARYVRIKEGMYVVSVIESNAEKLRGAAGRFRSNTLAFLQDYYKVYEVGRAFGTQTLEGVDSPINIMFTGYGEIFKVGDDVIDADNPFLI
jgi:hypothetical protein